MSFQQRGLLMKSFVKAQYGYCPLVWMFHGREINRKINDIHERFLRIFYRDYNSSFKGLLLKPGPWTRTLKNLDPDKHGKQLDIEK